jgi:hypothetical protein
MADAAEYAVGGKPEMIFHLACFRPGAPNKAASGFFSSTL